MSQIYKGVIWTGVIIGVGYALMKMVSPSESEIREVCILFLESHILQFMHLISMTFEAELYQVYVTFCLPPAPPHLHTLPAHVPPPSVPLSFQP